MTIPQGITSEEYEIGKDIVVKGFKKMDDQNKIRTDLVIAGINIDRHLTVFNAIAIHESLIVDPSKIRDDIKAIIDHPSYDFTKLTDYKNDLAPIIEYILDKVNNSDIKTISSVIKSKYKNMGLDCPKMPRAKTWSPVEKAIVDQFADDCDTTEKEYNDLIDKTIFKNQDKWKKMYSMFHCIAKGIYSSDGLK